MMRNNIKNRKWAQWILASAGVMLIASCQPEDLGEGNGLVGPELDASFTITPVEDAFNHYLLESNSQDMITSNWIIGARVVKNKFTHEIFLPDQGTYSIIHEAIGAGGLPTTATQELVVEESDPVAGNLVKGGRFDSAEDISQWTVLPISASGAAWTFENGVAIIHSDGGWAQQGIYQTIEVEAGRTYTIDMQVKGEAFDETWFEVYVGTTPPVEGAEYADTKIMGLSTWDGCATSPFEGALSEIGCITNTQTETVSNTFTAESTGTVYLVIRSGGNTFDPNGITIDEVEFRGS